VKHKCKIGSKELQKKSTMVEDAIEDLIALALEFKNGGAAAPPGGAAAPDPPDSESNSSAKASSIFCRFYRFPDRDKCMGRLCEF
jgi:hypothetical protein